MKMKDRKGFTLVELLAVVVIMAIIALIATPNIISLLERSKRSDFVSDAKEFASKANYMFKRMEQKGYDSLFTSDDPTNCAYKIKLVDIEGVNNLDDPYGGVYKDSESYVCFKSYTPTSGITQYNMAIYLKGCKESASQSKCYTVGNNSGGEVLVSELDISKVEGPTES